MTSSGPEKNFSIVIANAIAEMQRVVELVQDFAVHHALPQRLSNEFNICLDELISNTIAYGYDDQDRHEIAITLGLEGDVVIAEIRDDGRPFDPREAPPLPLDKDLQGRKIGGLGLHFVNSLMDGVSYARNGASNIVRIMKKMHT